MSLRHPADCPTTTTPVGSLLDMIQTAAWSGLINYLIGEEWALAQFTADTGIRPPAIRPRNPLDAMIDQACGYDASADAELRTFAVAFIQWTTQAHWGEDKITPTIRGVLDRLTSTETA